MSVRFRFASKVSQFAKNTPIPTIGNARLVNATKSASRIRCKSTTAPSKKAFEASTPKSASSSAATKATSKAQAVSSSQSESAPASLLVATAFAASAGIATVAFTATAIERATASNVPPFDPSGQRFDQSTFMGRFSKMVLACDPKLLLYSEEETRRSRAMVQNYSSLLQNIPEHMQQQEMHHALWEAQRISSAALHPDTEETIPSPFRMSGYVPFNGPICVAMVASTSTPSLLFWSWVNQSQNALVNYYNRNASSEMSNETLMKSYGTAVFSALTVAFGLATVIQKRYDATKAKQLMRWVAFPSAVVASSLNCYIVRSPEIGTGVPLVNEQGEDVLPGSTSQVAAREGVHSTTMSRAILQAPVYFLPPVLMKTVPYFKNLVKRNPAVSVPLTTYLVLVAFGLGLPSTVAIFPQMAEIDVKDCEDHFQGLTGKDGLPYRKYYYNKGL